MADQDVCALLSSGSQSSDWMVAGEASHSCMALIQRSFQSFEVFVHTALYVLFGYLLIQWGLGFCKRRQFTKALVKDLKEQGIMIPYQKI